MTDLIEEAARRFALLGEPTRLRILHTLMAEPELTVGEIARRTGTSRFNASAHLARLAAGGLVARRRAGNAIYYRSDDRNLPQICEWVRDSLRSRGRDLAQA